MEGEVYTVTSPPLPSHWASVGKEEDIDSNIDLRREVCGIFGNCCLPFSTALCREKEF